MTTLISLAVTVSVLLLTWWIYRFWQWVKRLFLIVILITLASCAVTHPADKRFTKHVKMEVNG